jgi:predicted transposase/invertase (TIGR01784 family)
MQGALKFTAFFLFFGKNRHKIQSKTAYQHHMLTNLKSNKQFTDMVKTIILELTKLPAETDGSDIWPWLQFLKCQTQEELEMLLKDHSELGEAGSILKKLSWSEKHLRRADLRDKWRHDYISERKVQYDLGKQEGKQEIARNLKAMGVPVDQIAAGTGLTPEQIAEL